MISKIAMLFIDIGNTSTVVAVEKANGFKKVRILTADTCTDAILQAVRLLRPGFKRPAAAIIASVVPTMNRLWSSVLNQAGVEEILFVSATDKLGLEIYYPKPETIGIDRLVNVAAAYSLMGGPVIAIDIGTATTFDCVTRDGLFIGGVISPGPRMFAEFMHEKTALLPAIKISGRLDAIGRNTESAMRIGARIGMIGLIRETVDYLRKNKDLRGAKLCLTGGYAQEVLEGSNIICRLEPDLTLKGLAMIRRAHLRFGAPPPLRA